MRDTIYFEIANGREEYWFYSDGARIFVSKEYALREARLGANVVRVK